MILVANKRSAIVSKARHEAGKRNAWVKALAQARSKLNVTGFQVAKKESELYKLAKTLMPKKHKNGRKRKRRTD